MGPLLQDPVGEVAAAAHVLHLQKRVEERFGFVPLPGGAPGLGERRRAPRPAEALLQPVFLPAGAENDLDLRGPGYRLETSPCRPSPVILDLRKSPRWTASMKVLLPDSFGPPIRVREGSKSTRVSR
jgi:hypothetical protein